MAHASGGGRGRGVERDSKQCWVRDLLIEVHAARQKIKDKQLHPTAVCSYECPARALFFFVSATHLYPSPFAPPLLLFYFLSIWVRLPLLLLLLLYVCLSVRHVDCLQLDGSCSCCCCYCMWKCFQSPLPPLCSATPSPLRRTHLMWQSTLKLCILVASYGIFISLAAQLCFSSCVCVCVCWMCVCVVLCALLQNLCQKWYLTACNTHSGRGRAGCNIILLIYVADCELPLIKVSCSLLPRAACLPHATCNWGKLVLLATCIILAAIIHAASLANIQLNYEPATWQHIRVPFLSLPFFLPLPLSLRSACFVNCQQLCALCLLLQFSSRSFSLSLSALLLLPIAILHYALPFCFAFSTCDWVAAAAFPLLFQLLLTLSFIYLLLCPRSPSHSLLLVSMYICLCSFFVASALCVQSSVISDIHACKQTHTYSHACRQCL